MNIGEKMRECGDGLYEIIVSELVYVGSYGMMGYTRYTIFKLIVKDKNIYSQKIYKINSWDKTIELDVTDKFDKIELVSRLLKLDYEDKCIYKFNYRTLKGDDYKC